MARRDTPQGLAWLVPVAVAVLLRPPLWVTALRQLAALAAPGWWRRPPHLPLPPASYLRFRMVTAYGEPEAVPAPGDVVTYLDWCRHERRRAGGRAGAGRARLRALAGQ